MKRPPAISLMRHVQGTPLDLRIRTTELGNWALRSQPPIEKTVKSGLAFMVSKISVAALSARHSVNWLWIAPILNLCTTKMASPAPTCDHSKCPCEVARIEKERRQREYERHLEQQAARDYADLRWMFGISLLCGVCYLLSLLFSGVPFFSQLFAATSLASFTVIFICALGHLEF